MPWACPRPKSGLVSARTDPSDRSRYIVLSLAGEIAGEAEATDAARTAAVREVVVRVYVMAGAR